MRAAVEALMDAPQNNLALFVGGHRRVVGPDGRDGLDAACALLRRANSSHLAATIRDVLVHEGVLDRLLYMQTLCQYDVHAIGEDVSVDVEDKGQGQEDVMDEKFSEAYVYDRSTMNSFLARMAKDESQCLGLLADYCTAATAKDCSILVAMTTAGTTNGQTTTRTKQGTRPCQLGILGDVAYRVTVRVCRLVGRRCCARPSRSLHVIHAIHAIHFITD